MAQGGADIRRVECCKEAVAMSPDATILLDPQPELKNMEVEPPGITVEPMELDAQLPAHDQGDQQIEQGAPTTGDECTMMKQVDSSPEANALDGVAHEPEPEVETPPAKEEPVVEGPASKGGCPQDSQEDDQVEVHTPNDNPDDW